MYNYELCIMNYELIFMSDIAIKVENLSKYYRLGVINNGTLFKDMQSWFARLLGKEDPNAKIGSTYKDSKEGFWALKDLNFEIKKGDRVGIIGHNGAGKSTLLKVLSQITTPTEGNIKINGRVASLLEVGTGFHPEMTGRENIYMNGAILGMKKSEIDKKVDQIIEFSEIGEHIDTPVKRYSSGMYVRLAFAVAAHLDSDILIADEVLAVGDAAFQKKALGKMNELSTGEGRTVLFVSHNMDAIRNLCNIGIVLNHGKIKYAGELETAIKLYLSDARSESGMSLSAFKEFMEDGTKDFQLRLVKIIDEFGNNLQIFEAQRDIFVYMECIVRKTVPGLYGYFVVYTAQNRPLIIFDSRECKTDLMSNMSEGKHIFKFKIRAGMLSCGTYDFYVNFTSNMDLKNFTIDSPKYCCRFEVKDSFSKRGENRGAMTSYIPEIEEVTC